LLEEISALKQNIIQS